MSVPTGCRPALLPLLLVRVHPGLASALFAEGIPFVEADRDPSLRFVLFDSSRIPEAQICERLADDQVAIDVADLPGLDELIDNTAMIGRWEIGGRVVRERVSRIPRAIVRRRVVTELRRRIEGAGGIWARLSRFPAPYTSAFNFRADLDEPYPEDYARYARARRPIDDCSTHFISTAAYGDCPDVLEGVRACDAQSHGHHHFIYRDEAANLSNLSRAHEILQNAGIDPVGFACPESRWNAGLDRTLERLGYLYSSDFSLGYDDWPFFPHRDGRFSTVLQIPIHPICEGLLLDAGASGGDEIGEHLVSAIERKTRAGVPAFVYGHPERRLGRFPEVVSRIAGAIQGRRELWRVTLTEFARFWLWRSRHAWRLVEADQGMVWTCDDNNRLYPLRLEIHRGNQVATLPLDENRVEFEPDSLPYEDAPDESSADFEPTEVRERVSPKRWIREALDWEKVTPIDDLPAHTIRTRLKRRLRILRK